ncbi:MAG: universal stress protein [Pseudomonadota bacterium]
MTRFRKILFVDNPDTSQGFCIERAVSLADSQQAELTVLHVAATPRLGIFAEITGNNSEAVRSRLEAEAMARLKAQWRDVSRPVQFAVRSGTGFIEIIREVLEGGFDLVIVITDGEQAGSSITASNERHLLRKCPCPVWLMRPMNQTYQSVVAALDFDPWDETNNEDTLNRQILDIAAELALAESAGLTLVHVWAPISERMISVFASELSTEQIARNIDRERREREVLLRELADGLRSRIGKEGYEFIAPRFHLAQGEPGERIPAIAQSLGADLVVMGTVARTGIPGLIIGNTAETIIDSLHCSILAVKPDGFESPVRLPD